MSVKLNTCSKCGSSSYKKIRITKPCKDPVTKLRGMNDTWLCKCNDCGLEQEHKITAQWIQDERKLGRIR